MKKLSILSILSLSLLLLTACGEDAKEKTSEAKKEVKETTTPAKATNEAVLNEVKETTAEKTTASTPAVNLTVCLSCHGSDFGLKALGASKVVKDMTKADIIASLKGYQDGTYGGNMKAIMLPQVAALSDADIKAIAAIIIGN